MQHPKENSGINNDIKENIEKDNTLSITDKIKTLRNHKGISQQAISDYALMGQKKISRIENGEYEYDKTDLEVVKRFLGIEGMPLTEDECSKFRRRLYHWHNLIKNRQVYEATVLQDELKNIVSLELFYFDLPTLYRIFEVLFLLTEISLSTETIKDFSVVEEKLKYLEGVFDEMNTEHRYYYNYNLGTFYSLKNDCEKALEYYKQALDIKKQHKDVLSNDEERLYYSLALCYTDLEQPNRALAFLNKIPKRNPNDITTKYSLGIDIMSAINHYKIGLYDEAEEILNDCLKQAEGINNETSIGLVLQNLGVLHLRQENYERAIWYFDHSLNFFDEDTRYHAWALYYKIRCMIGLRNFNEAERTLRQISPSLKKNDKYITLLETLKHIAYLSRNVSRYDKTPTAASDFFRASSLIGLMMFSKYRLA